MSRIEHIQPAQPGILITRVRGYNLFTAIFLGGRGRLDRTLARLSGARAGDRVLDVCSGPGALAAALTAEVGAGGAVVGIDASPPMVTYSTKHAGRQPNCHFEYGIAQDLNFPDGSFDVVTSTFAMHHIPESERPAAIAHMFRVLRPGGRLLLADMHPTGRIHPALVRILSRLASHGTSETATRGLDPVESVDIRQYRTLLSDAGFEGFDFTTVKRATGVLTAVKAEA